jgi:hypothetical protein
MGAFRRSAASERSVSSTPGNDQSSWVHLGPWRRAGGGSGGGLRRGKFWNCVPFIQGGPPASQRGWPGQRRQNNLHGAHHGIEHQTAQPTVLTQDESPSSSILAKKVVLSGTVPRNSGRPFNVYGRSLLFALRVRWPRKCANIEPSSEAQKWPPKGLIMTPTGGGGGIGYLSMELTCRLHGQVLMRFTATGMSAVQPVEQPRAVFGDNVVLREA